MSLNMEAKQSKGDEELLADIERIEAPNAEHVATPPPANTGAPQHH